MMIHVFFFVAFVRVYIISSLPLEEPQVWGVAAVSGNPASLPCIFSERARDDNPLLILWYKKGTKKPIFTHDGRLPSYHSGIQKQNLQLRISEASANLSLITSSLSDRGTYQCRIDFARSPVHTSFVNLTIIDPPYSVEIYDQFKGRERNGVIGPYLEGESMRLTCVARGGTPKPNITWWYEKSFLHSVTTKTEGVTPNAIKSEFIVNKLNRKWDNKSLTCSAANSRLVNPVVAAVEIFMHLLPQTVVVTYIRPAMEGSNLRLKCVTWGSKPPARITWTVRGVTFPPEREEFLDGGQRTSSSLYLNVTRDDDEGEVKCSAANPEVPRRSISNSTYLTVHYTPSVEVTLGHNLKPASLKEGIDIYFTCRIKANPLPDSIKWYHNGVFIHENKSRGVILSGKSLVLQKVHRSNAGQYQCSASNYLANVTSRPSNLRLKYKPECKTTPTTYFIYDTPINVSCKVTSHPLARNVHWRWNTGTDVINSQPFSSFVERTSNAVSVDQDESSACLTVYPSKNPEDRELACWAVNEMGTQEEPCTFAIKVAKTPAPLSSCRLANITTSSLSLTCDQPDVNSNGGKLYTAEVYLENSTLFANVTSMTPNFNVSQLDPGTSYQIKVYVSYGQITSLPLVVSAYTSRTTKVELIPAESRPAESEAGYTGVFMWIALLSLGMAFTVILGRFFCKRRRRTRNAPHDKEEAIDIPEDENPDVVPSLEIEGPL